MTSATSASTARVLADVLARVPLAGAADVHTHLVDAHQAIPDALDPDLANMIRLRVAMLLGCEAELDDPELVALLPRWPDSPAFDTRAKACLAFAEQFVIDVASLPDEMLEAVRAELGDDGLSSFAHTLLVIEQRQRLALAWQRLVPEFTP